MKARKSRNNCNDLKSVGGLFLRYVIIILIALPNLYLFYLVFTPLTIYSVYYALSIVLAPLSKVMLFDSILVLEGFSVEIIPACVAGAAYYLLFALNLSIPNIGIKKRMAMIGFSFASLLVFNVLRIIILILALYAGQSAAGPELLFFDAIHKAFWCGMNIAVVVGIWFAGAWLFKVRQIPVYTDLKFLYKQSLFSKPDKKTSKGKSKRKN